MLCGYEGLKKAIGDTIWNQYCGILPQLQHKVSRCKNHKVSRCKNKNLSGLHVMWFALTLFASRKHAVASDKQLVPASAPRLV